ncbi:tetratricopeptide repeat protein [Filimonas effusa]|uniref:Tetratricopeptide repeat protein n=2 Tax=Filimonas effusa TaxID=2508721 RepID=A0A4Q1D9E2_9BACT|nr:tetratricopeptide repeat protein [Filimonas effusa]
MRVLSAVFICLFGAVTTHAQFSADYRRAADNYFKKGDYSSAVSYYEKYLNISRDKKTSAFDPYSVSANKKSEPVPDKQLAIYQLAESWRLLKNYTNAAPLYQQLLAADSTFPLAGFHYGTCLRTLGRYADAEEAFQQFLTHHSDGGYTVAAQREIKNLQYIRQQLQKDISSFTVNALAAGRTGASYAPVAIGEEAILFTATWPDSNAAANKIHLNRLYQAGFSASAISNVAKAGMPSGALHEGAATVSADGNTIYLTKWQVIGDRKNAAIYISNKIASTDSYKWSDPVILDSVVNLPGYNAQQPFITADGKTLFYASDKPGGLGGYDLWSAVLNEQGKPVSTQNLGAIINTPYNEQAPYYHEPSATFVFASDGRTGMGGYDLFFAKGRTGEWSQPENFGYPVNSMKDDMYFLSFSKGRRVLENALFSSDRADVCCLELFHLTKKAPPKQVIGQVVSCDSKTPLAGVAVDVIDTITGTKMYSGITDADGRYSFAINQATPLNSVAALKGYYTAARPLQWSDEADADSVLSIPICMEKEVLVVDEIQVLNNVYYEFAKADIKPESYPSLDDVVALLNKRPEVRVEIGGHTDDKGSDELNMRLSQARADNVVAYLVSKGINQNRLVAKGYGATMPIAPNKKPDGSDNPEGREKNRRTEMKVLQ